jgi:hypothetical protein
MRADGHPAPRRGDHATTIRPVNTGGRASPAAVTQTATINEINDGDRGRAIAGTHRRHAGAPRQAFFLN